MKRALILAYDFPPYVSVGGLRPYSWYKHFKEEGIEPIIVTRQWANDYQNELDYIAPSPSKETIIESDEYGTVIRTPYKPNLSNRLLLKYGHNRFRLIRKIITAWFELSQYFFISGTKKEIYLAADEFLKKNKVDIIIATAEPFILFKYASILSKKENTLWIADYRDPWSQDKSRSKLGFLRILDKYFEKHFLKNATLVTTVTPFFKIEIAKLVEQEIRIIPNGYDESVTLIADSVSQNSEQLTIACAGTIHQWHPWQSFLNQLDEFLKQNPTASISVKFYGISNENEIREVVNLKSRLKDIVEFIPKVPNEILVKELSKANVLLLFNYYSYVGTKIYDYLALKRKIIFCYADDQGANHLKERYYNMPFDSRGLKPQIEILTKTNSGIIVQNEETLIPVIKDLYKEHSANGYIKCDSSSLEQYSRKEQSKLMCNLITELTN